MPVKKHALNAYTTALHRVLEPLGWSAFKVHGELTKLDAAGDLPNLLATMPSVSTLSQSIFEGWRSVVAEAARSAPVLAEGDRHLWAGLRLTEVGFTERSELEHLLRVAVRALGDIESNGSALAALLHIPAPDSVVLARIVRDFAAPVPADHTLRPDWLDIDQHARAAALANEADHRAGTALALRAELLAGYGGAILDAATPEAIASYEAGWFSRLLSGAHRRARSEVRTAAIDGQPRPLSDELKTLRRAAGLRAELAWFRDHAASLNSALGVGLAPDGIANVTDLAARRAALAATGAIIDRYRPAPVPEPLVGAITAPGAGRLIADAGAALTAALVQLDGHVSGLSERFEPSALVAFCDAGTLPLDQVSLSAYGDWLTARLNRLDDLDDWLRARRAADAVQDAGLTDAVVELHGKDVPPGRWVDTLTRTVLHRWLDHVHQLDSTLSRFNGTDHEREVETFRQLDHYQIAVADRRVRRRLAAAHPSVISGVGEDGILRREAKKSRNVRPLRWLFANTSTLIPKLKPCLMMSPLSVAQFLPADRYNFDVVIFDEASQVRPHDAIGAIMRGKQVIVAGDSKQLPPDTTFERQGQSEDQGDEDTPADNLADVENILDALGTLGMPSAPLLWHYRSRHEDLIAFSNHNIYGGRLITFPSPGAERGPDAGVRLEYVADGVYDVGGSEFGSSSNRANPIEARRVVDLIMAHARERSDISLGVVSLNERHRETILETLIDARKENPEHENFFAEDREEPFFVKALEQVQGDERDVVMIAIGFGHDRKGDLRHNFGPINKEGGEPEGGERRLNVLVTRARHQIVVISSIRAGDIQLSKTKNRGPQLLRDYLDFAERGAIALPQATSGGDGPVESPFEASVLATLEAAGYKVRTQVGASKYRIDLAVVNPRQPGRYLLGVECDGASYHSSRTARDRDRLRQEILEGLGWEIHRVWSTDWIRNPEREFKRLTDRIEYLLARPAEEAPVVRAPVVVNRTPPVALPNPASSRTAVDVGTQTFTIPTDRPSLLRPYRPVELNPQPGEMTAASLATVAQVISEVVVVEGPVHREVLGQRLRAAWGHGRQGSRIVAHLDEAISLAVRRGNVRHRGDFLWPPTTPGFTARGPSLEGESRRIGHIADEEIALGMVAVLGHAVSPSADELIVQTTRAFGFQRVGPDNRARLVRVLDAAVASKQIEAVGEMYRLPRT